MDSHVLNTTASVALLSHPLVSRNTVHLVLATLSYLLASNVVCMFRIVRMHPGISSDVSGSALCWDGYGNISGWVSLSLPSATRPRSPAHLLAHHHNAHMLCDRTVRRAVNSITIDCELVLSQFGTLLRSDRSVADFQLVPWLTLVCDRTDSGTLALERILHSHTAD